MGSRLRWGYGIEIAPDRVHTAAIAVNTDGELETLLGRPAMGDPIPESEPMASHVRFERQAEEAARQLGELRQDDGGRGPVHLAVWDPAWEDGVDGIDPGAPMPGEMTRAIARHLDEAGITVDAATTSTAAVQRLGPAEADVMVWAGDDQATVLFRRAGEVIGVSSMPRHDLPSLWRRGGLGRAPVGARGAAGFTNPVAVLAHAAPSNVVLLDGQALRFSTAPGSERTRLPLAALGAAATAAGFSTGLFDVMTGTSLPPEPADPPLRAWGVQHQGPVPVVVEESTRRISARVLAGLALGGGLGGLALAAAIVGPIVGPW